MRLGLRFEGPCRPGVPRWRCGRVRQRPPDNRSVAVIDACPSHAAARRDSEPWAVSPCGVGRDLLGNCAPKRKIISSRPVAWSSSSLTRSRRILCRKRCHPVRPVRALFGRSPATDHLLFRHRASLLWRFLRLQTSGAGAALKQPETFHAITFQWNLNSVDL